MTGPAAGGGGTGPVYNTDQEFFELFLSQLFARPKRFRWCAQWRDHEEALFVIKVLHDSYERTVAMMPDEIGVWLRDYAYTLFFDRLCVEDGTFTDCDWQSETHNMPLPLTTI